LRIRNGFDRRVTRVRVHAHAGEVWACANREEARMNKNELHGGARYLGGKVEKAVGDAVDSRDWQVDGVVDQVAGGAENLYGRARSVAEDAADAAPGFVDAAKERLADARHTLGDAAARVSERAHDIADRATDRAHDMADRASDRAHNAGAVAGRGGRAANAAVANSPAVWAIGAAVGGYLLGWLIHGERA
jgi:uncharacterized protein YjbJ (UPF0337 family)